MTKERPLKTAPFSEALKSRARDRRRSARNLSSADAGFPGQLRNDLLPALSIEMRATSSLKAPARNVRDLDPAHVRETARAIETLGFTVPILIDRNGSILDGAVRLEAAKQVGLSEVPTICISHLSKSETRLLRLAVNRLQERGTWNLEFLKLEFEELILEDAPIEIVGFSAPEIDQILLGDEIEGIEPGPVQPNQTTSQDIKLGDVFMLGPHRLICGDARDPAVLAKLMGEDTAALVLTDQPFNVPIAGHASSKQRREFAMASGEMAPREFEDFSAAWIEMALRYLNDGGILAIFIDWRNLSIVQAAAKRHLLHQINLIVWTKSNAGMGSLYRSQHELLPLFKKGSEPHINNVSLGRHGRWRSNVWAYPGATSMGSDARSGLKEHPTVKPVGMLQDALLDMTNRNDIVLDPFAGSGSTLIAAENTGRICRAIEVDPLYVDLIIRRYHEISGESPARVV